MELRIARIYDPVGEDGVRVLVDRLWPRGVSKERADLDLWAKEATPSTELRHLWHAPHATDTEEGRERLAEAFEAELSEGDAAEALEQLVLLLRGKPLATLLTGAKHPDHSHVPVLRAVLERRLK
ncbi:DUF488 domain-containing protein [Leucobacter luti]|uniref:DUF488 domain-containing protein n=1 Tax=Leucobacter luti TaxID=340320 RepID=UPI003D01AFB1